MVDLDKQMQAIREEIDAYRCWVPVETPATSVAHPSESSGSHNVEELFKLSDVEFARAAYRTLLGREVDPTGFHDILENLRLGRSDRLTILHNLKRSEEGRRYAAPVVLPPQSRRLRKLSERLDPRKVIHKLLGIREFVKLGQRLKSAERGPLALSALPFVVNDLNTRLLDIEAAAEDVRKLNGAHAALQSQLESIEARLAGTEAAAEDVSKLNGAHAALQSQLGSIEARLAGTEAAAEDVSKLNAAHTALQPQLESIEARLATSYGDFQTLSGHAGRMDQSISEHGQRLLEIQTELARIETKAREHWRHIADQAGRLSILINEARRRLPEKFNAEQLGNFVNEGEKHLSALYVSFEDRYRGTREDILQRQSVYLPFVKEAAEAISGASFVDIGSGRGEFLELLRANGLNGRGLDLNPVMVEECRQRGLEAIEGDALTFLRSLPPASMAGISGFHIIEHLPHRVLIELIDEALRALAPGGLLIFETPNPANLLVAAERFYVDPTHLNPLPSETVSFMAEARGFVRVNVLPLHPVPSQRRDYDDPMLALLQDKLYGPQDYGLIAWKAW